MLWLSSSVLLASDYVGSGACVDCHQSQYDGWMGSHHERAMDHASADSVRGDFNDVYVDFKGKKNHFYKKDGQFWVNIADANGEFNDYQIKFTFGYEPLQQYMVQFDDGRVQLIPFAWDTREKSEGGQRWFYLHPEHSDSHHEFFWTNSGQNWNYMCADCHSTNVKKQFDTTNNQYATSYSEINVGCEACHGPASKHIELVQSQNTKGSKSQLGFERNLGKAVSEWMTTKEGATAKPSSINPTDQVMTCAQCHSRHTQISEQDHVTSGNFGDRYLLTLINGQHYYPDGQVYDEDYVYGSFLQSKMNANGVVCSNCHDPHTAKLKIPAESVCLQCHQPETYASESHHHHPLASEGAQCVNCHMPETTYMQVDARREHKWHVPRPDFSQKIGTPDVCLSCHTDKSSAWSAKVVEGWNPNSRQPDERHFAPVFSAVDQGYGGAAQALSHIAQNENHSDIIRASAIERLAPFTDANAVIAVARGAKHPSEFVRLGAVRGAANMPPAERWRILSPLLKDPVLAIRTETVSTLLPLWQQLNDEQKAALETGFSEYQQVQAFNSDRGFAHVNLGNLFLYRGMMEEAQAAYENSIRIEPGFDAAYIYLSELYRQQGEEQQAKQSLLRGLALNPENGEFPYRLGLAEIRAKQYQQAQRHFRQATKINPQQPQYHYVLALALEKTRPQAAVKSLRQAYTLSRDPQQLYALCEMQLRYRIEGAEQCLSELSAFAPNHVITNLRNQYRN